MGEFTDGQMVSAREAKLQGLICRLVVLDHLWSYQGREGGGIQKCKQAFQNVLGYSVGYSVIGLPKISHFLLCFFGPSP